MPATASYDITLNALGYTLLQESYRKQVQTPYVARFSTGDPSAGDLSFWQHIFQDKFNGGNGQNHYEIKNKFFRSHGMVSDPLKKELYQSRQPVLVTSRNIAGSAASFGFLNKVKAVSCDGITVISAPISGTDWAATFTAVGTTADHVVDKHELWATPSLCCEYWSRDTTSTAGRKGFMVGLHNTVSFNEIPGLLATATYTVPSFNANGTITSAVQCTIDVFCFGQFRPDAVDGSSISFIKFQNDSLANVVWTMNVPIGHYCPMRMIIDKDGHMWVLMAQRLQATFSATATNNWVDSGVSTTLSNSSFLYRYNAGSLDSDPYSDLAIPLPGYIFKDMEILGDSIYLFGEKIGDPSSSTSNLFYPVVYKVGFGEIFKGYASSASMRCSYVFNMGHKILFSMVEDNYTDTTLQPITVYSLYPGDIIETEAQFDNDVASTVYPIGVFVHANNLYLVTNDTEASSTEGIYRFNTAINFASGLLDDKWFISSLYTADSPLISKYITDVVVKLTGAINTTNQNFQVYLFTDETTLTSLGNFTNGNRTQTFTTTANTTARVFRIILRSAALVDAQQFGVESLDVRFVPVPLKRYQWSLGIRLDIYQKLLNSSYEATIVSTKLSDLQAAYRDNASVTFVDIDATSYTVMVTDLIVRAPLVKEQTTDQEYICFLELLET